MATPVVDNSSFANSGTPATSLAITHPTGIVSGDLAQTLLMSDDNGASQTWQAETGWNGPESGISGGDGTSDSKVAVMTRKWDGTEGSSTTFDHSSADDLMGWMQRITGADADSPFNVKAAAVDIITTTTTHVYTGVTTTGPNRLAFFYGAVESGAADPFTVSGTGWSKGADGDGGDGTASGVAGVWGTRAMAVAGATGNATAEASAADNGVGAQWAIAEAAGAAPARVSLVMGQYQST